MSEIARVFDQQLRLVVLPTLDASGFKFDRSRTFRRAMPDGSIQIVNFQMGQRSLEGQFTVNLGVYRPGNPVYDAGLSHGRVMEFNCEKRTRFGALGVSPARARLRKIPYLGSLFGGMDRWWPASRAEQITRHSLEQVMDLVIQNGLPWLDRQ